MAKNVTASVELFEVGDVVELITGGPDMSVIGVDPDEGSVDVAYFRFSDTDGWIFEAFIVPEEVLQPVGGEN